MIRINLARNRASDNAGSTGYGQTGYSTYVGSANGGRDSRDAFVKMAVLAVPLAGLMLFESQNLSALSAEQSRLQSQVQELETQSQAKAKEVESLKDVESQAREMDDKLKILKTLSHLRLREVKTLDFVQNVIPEKVWLKSLTYEADKDKMEPGHYNFGGISVSTEDLSDFVKRLDESSYLSDVIVMKNQETSSSGRKVVLRDFSFTAQVEVHL